MRSQHMNFINLKTKKKKRGLNRNRDGRKEGEDRREIDNFLERER